MPPRSPRKRPVPTAISDDEPDSGGSSSSESDPRKGQSDQQQFIVQTNFDSYFSHIAARSQTSNTVFSTQIPLLSAEEYAEAIKPVLSRPQRFQSSICTDESKRALFSRFMRELDEGFNLLFHGFGSKRQYLNQFATERCAKRGHVVVANGFHPGFGLRDLVASFGSLPGFSDAEISTGSLDERIQSIHKHFLASKRHLYLIVHNIDGPFFRTTKAKSVLSMWAMNPHIHLVASIDHINAPLLFSTSEMSARKHSSDGQSNQSRGYAWLWHDLTTLLPYDFELSYADRSSIRGAHGLKAKDIAAQGLGAAMTETAALHILASVTQKAKKLFKLMGDRQVEGSSEAGTDPQELAIEYDALFNLARDNFVATSDAAMRSVLGEFKDHGLVLTAQSGTAGGQALWIPLRKERLNTILASLDVA
ncbi:hypothetical protein ONZ45_g14486 [Pleurotus djamor]|nr:hypothetical protein ONZ45_g14486 [Pleurotus djamor]